MQHKAIIAKWKEAKEEDFGTVIVRNLLDTEKVPNMSVNYTLKKNNQKKPSKSKTDLSYYILSETGFVIIDNIKNNLEKGDVVFIPKNTGYIFSFGIECIAFSSPRFKR